MKTAFAWILTGGSQWDWKSFLPVLLEEFPAGLWESCYSTLLTALLSYLIGLPLGILLVTGEPNGLRPLPRWLMAFLNGMINLLRSIPFLLLMIMVLPLSGLVLGTKVGTPASILPLTIAAFPFVARMVESALREVSPGVVEAARSMGASPAQVVTRVLLPEALPALVNGATISVTNILGYSAMAAMIGGGGMGKIAVNYGYYRFNYAVMYPAVLVLVVLVQLFQLLGTRLARHLDHSRPPRTARRRRTPEFQDSVCIESKK